jgi:hypothetical protein
MKTTAVFSSFMGDVASVPRAETVASKKEAFKMAETKSVYHVYHGPGTYQNVKITENLELYFRLFVFAASSMPEACFTLYAMFFCNTREYNLGKSTLRSEMRQ